jgi:hypothetical protein
MTVTADTEAIKIPKSLEDLFGGQMTCDTAGCKAIFGHPVDLDSDFHAPPRQQLQRAAVDGHGWKQTLAGLSICSDCACGPLGLVVAEEPHWNTQPRAEPLPPVMVGDDVATIALPAIRVADLRTSAGRRPYDTNLERSA